MKKKTILIIAILALVLTFGTPALALTIETTTPPPAAESTQAPGSAQSQNTPGAHVVDMADLLSSEQEMLLKDKLESISNRHNCDVVVVTTKDIGSKTAEAFADDYFDYNGYRPDGILLLVSIGTRDWHVSTTGKGIKAVTNSALKRIERDVVSDLSDAKYYRAFDTYGNLCDEFLTKYANGTPYKENPIKAGFAAVAAAVAGALTGGIGTGKMRSKLKSVQRKTNAGDYVRAGSLDIVDSREMFLFKNVTRTEIPRESSSGGGTHTSSSGVSHGGGGGKF